jgi:hypothetical protein
MSVAQELQELVQLQQQALDEASAQQQQQQQQQQQYHHARPGINLHPPAAGGVAGAGAWQQAQLAAANSELQQQLQGATSKLQEMERTMARLLDQQVIACGCVWRHQAACTPLRLPLLPQRFMCVLLLPVIVCRLLAARCRPHSCWPSATRQWARWRRQTRPLQQHSRTQRG